MLHLRWLGLRHGSLLLISSFLFFIFYFLLLLRHLSAHDMSAAGQRMLPTLKCTHSVASHRIWWAYSDKCGVKCTAPCWAPASALQIHHCQSLLKKTHTHTHRKMVLANRIPMVSVVCQRICNKMFYLQHDAFALSTLTLEATFWLRNVNIWVSVGNFNRRILILTNATFQYLQSSLHTKVAFCTK